jgi:hypothetical protein
VKDATCKNKLYLSGESVEWGLVEDFEPNFQCSKNPLDGNPEARVFKIEQFLCILWAVSWREIVQMIIGFPDTWRCMPSCLLMLSELLHHGMILPNQLAHK